MMSVDLFSAFEHSCICLQGVFFFTHFLHGLAMHVGF
jgi:hypothetical protein